MSTTSRKMNLHDLPNELILSVANHIERECHLSHLARTSRHLYTVLTPILYRGNIKYGKCSGLKAQLTPLNPPNFRTNFYQQAQEDLHEYNHPSPLTTPEGLPLPLTDKIRTRDAVIAQFVKYGANLDALVEDERYNIGDPPLQHYHPLLRYHPLLHYHAHTRNLPAVILLVRHGAGVHFPNPLFKLTALHLAAQEGSPKIIRFLLSSGADVHARDDEDRTPLHYAAEARHVAAIRILVESGTDIDAQDVDGCTPLHVMMMNRKPAPDKRCTPALQVMLEFGAKSNLGIFEDGKTALHVAILNQRDMDFIEPLITAEGINLNARTVEGRTPLSCCIERGKMQVFMLLVKQGADVSTRDEDGCSLLQNALEDEDRAWECLPTLLENGLYTLDSDAGGKTLAQHLKERNWVYTVKGRVEGMPEIDNLSDS
ncbi:ankyrin repeat domain-containing protein [Aspergillus lucknowensis]|uniref:Ankyrin repeat-containing domain protein n=1 Tax=Aspergillus lucknowensis TaxID=176173 RepID=A0ABR4LV39_9EURO